MRKSISLIKIGSVFNLQRASQGLESVVAGLIRTVAGNSGGGAMAFNIDTSNRQLHSFEQSLADLLASDSEHSAE